MTEQVLERGSRARPAFPAITEKYMEVLVFQPIRAKTVPKSAMILAGSGKNPYTIELGDFSVEQGVKYPCSVKNRDISRLTRRLFAVPTPGRIARAFFPGASKRRPTRAR